MMNINIGREAVVTNPLKNNLRPLPQIDDEPFIEISDGIPVLVLDGPLTYTYSDKHHAVDIPFWVVRVLDGHDRDRVGWMAEISQSGKTILTGI